MVSLKLLARLNEVLTLGNRAPPEVPFWWYQYDISRRLYTVYAST